MNAMPYALALLIALTALPALAQGPGRPVIDMHLHAYPLSEFGPTPPVGCFFDDDFTWNGIDPSQPFDLETLATCRGPMPAPATDVELLSETLATLEQHNVVLAVTTGALGEVSTWRAADPDRILPAVHFFTDNDAPESEYADVLRRLVVENQVQVFAEVTAQYRGLAPNDPSLEPFFALAEELDIPVGIHMGYGAPGGPYWAYPNYRASLGNPLLLEEVLVRHPRMRLYVMHAGFPMVDELIMLLYSHPQVYVDISSDNGGQRRQEFNHSLRRLVDAGYGKRIMYGSDQMVWPQIIDVAIDGIESADFLTAEQKRDIFYNNAARFLRLSPETIARHHAR